MTPELVRNVLSRDDLFAGEPCDSVGNPAALPGPALRFLTNLVGSLEVHRAIEFGSGRSTRALLDAGITVTSIEDSPSWMRCTIQDIGDHKDHTQVVLALQTVWDQGAPFLSWEIQGLETAEFVLIDSPYYPPFREAVLLRALRQMQTGVIVLDDTRIPTLARFCDRIAARNPHLLHRRSQIGHGFDVFAKLTAMPIRDRRGLLETVKAYRRFMIGRRHHLPPTR
jgi:hypothetical protein